MTDEPVKPPVQTPISFDKLDFGKLEINTLRSGDGPRYLTYDGGPPPIVNLFPVIMNNPFGLSTPEQSFDDVMAKVAYPKLALVLKEDLHGVRSFFQEVDSWTLSKVLHHKDALFKATMSETKIASSFVPFFRPNDPGSVHGEGKIHTSVVQSGEYETMVWIDENNENAEEDGLVDSNVSGIEKHKGGTAIVQLRLTHWSTYSFKAKQYHRLHVQLSKIIIKPRVAVLRNRDPDFGSPGTEFSLAESGSSEFVSGEVPPDVDWIRYDSFDVGDIEMKFPPVDRSVYLSYKGATGAPLINLSSVGLRNPFGLSNKDASLATILAGRRYPRMTLIVPRPTDGSPGVGAFFGRLDDWVLSCAVKDKATMFGKMTPPLSDAKIQSGHLRSLKPGSDETESVDDKLEVSVVRTGPFETLVFLEAGPNRYVRGGIKDLDLKGATLYIQVRIPTWVHYPGQSSGIYHKAAVELAKVIVQPRRVAGRDRAMDLGPFVLKKMRCESPDGAADVIQ